MHPRWEIPGFDFRPNGGWRVKARRVAAVRRQLLASRNFSTLNAPAMGGPAASTAVTGTLAVPALFFAYSTTNPADMRDTAQYSSVLFAPSGGNPYTLRTYYDGMSDGRLTLTGKVMGWVRLANPESTYTGPRNCTGNPFGTPNCNGIFSVAAVASMQTGFRQALDQVDGGVDFGQFDNDGADGNPNSGDDDGRVDMIMFAHATRDGACGGTTNNHIWSHRFALVNSTQTAFQDYVTNDPSAEGGTIKISDYFATSALGGSLQAFPTTSPCDSTQIMPIGTAAHEFGHALGLPDLYDTGGATEGIGQWGLMGSGNFTSAWSPSRMEAWSLNELGWLTLVPLTTTNTYRLGAAPVSDTAFFVNVQGSNPRTESFLIENRQASQADTAVIRIHCSRSGNLSPCPPPGGGGLLIWHIDGAKGASSGFHAGNRVNTGPIFGVKLMQGDGLNQLNDPAATAPRRRGDAGDPYPGVSGNTVFSFRTNPAALKNVDSSFVGFAVDSIRQVETGGEMAFRLRFGALTTVQANFPGVVVQVDGSPYSVFKDLLEEGSSHTVSVADPQLSSDERTRFRFDSWSDGGAAMHTITGSLAGGTLTANMNRDFKLVATAGSGGTIAADTAVNLSGDFIPQGRDVVLTASVTTAPQFCGWSGADTASNSNPLTLPMERPFSVLASFGTSAAITSAAARPNGVMGAAYNDQLEISGGSGIMVWSVTGGALPQGVNLDPATGVLSGYPRQSGDFSYQATVTSCSTVSQTFTFSVSTPTLATADVVTQLLGPAAPLNADEVRYLDYLGNNNTQFDIGDFLAWVKATGAPLSAAILSTMREKGGRP